MSAGIAMMPFLPKLMRGTTDVVNIYVYYVLYLLQTVVSYLFFAYKGILLTADQKRYVSDLVTYAFQIAMNIIQIISLFLIHSFFVYTVIAIFCEIMRNIVVALVVDRKYPYIEEIAVPLASGQKKDIFSRVYAMSLYRISSVVGTATDNLIIAANISVMVVGLYDNYYMIIQVIEKLLKGFFQAFTSSLGNYYVLESKAQNEKIFRCLNRLNSWLVIFCSVSFMVLLQPFIELCFGEMYLLEYSVVIIIVYNFATNYQQNVVQIYKDASGLFVKGKYRAVMTAVLNLGISIILVRKIGLSGVFLGSIISRLVTTWWYDVWLLYRYGFKKSPVRFYLDCILTMLLIILNAGIIEWLCRPWRQTTIWTFIIRGIFCITVPNLVCLIFFGRSEECQYLLQKGRNLIAEKRKR